MSEYQNLCPGCFKENGADAVCPSCGCDEKAERDMLCFPIRTLLHQQYLIGRVLGDGGFGITYLAWDTKLETRVAIKEYMPDGLAGRGSGGLNVRPRSSKHTDGFAYGRDRFLEEARTLARFDHANIMRVRTFFEENGTGYLVMDYYDGVSLAEYLEKHDGKISEKAALEIMTPIMDGLREVHSKKFLQRDIKPQNIYLTAGNRPVLLDFGSARMDAGERSKNLTIILSPGFAPYEQYHSKGNQGPWTDIYACAAVLCKMVTKTTPPEAIERNKKDELVPPKQLVPEISPGFNRAILKALAVEPEDRPQSIEKFQKILAPGYTGTELMEPDPEEFNFVECPHCNAKNKIPKDKPLKEVKCIKCKKILEKPETEAEKKERQEVEKQKQEQDRILREAEELKLRETREQELREREEEARSKKIAKLVKKGNSILEYKSYDRAIKYFKDILEIDAEHKEGQELLLKAQTEKSEAEKLKREEIERDEQERIRREAVELKQREAKRKEKEARDEQVRERKREREEEVKRKKIAKQKNAKPESSSFIKSVPGVIWGLAGIGAIAVLALLIWLIIHNGNVKSQQAALNEQIKQIEADKQRIADEKAALEEKARLAEAKKKQQEIERIKREKRRLASENAELEEEARLAEIEKIQMEIKQRNAEEKARLAELSTSIAKYDTEVAKLNVLVTEASKQNYTGTPRVNLRSSYSTLDTDDVKSMLKRYNFFDSSWNKNGEFQNDYKQKSINGDRVVIDHATGLMWHQSGSSNYMMWNAAADWVKDLNRRGYAGHNDWRLPTVEEAASLLESSKGNNDLYIDSVFDKKQWWIWTGNKKDGSEAAWFVHFYDGSVNWDSCGYNCVRPVRSGK